MPRSIWKGAITFGLITIPVGLFTAIEEKDFRFNQLHGKDNGRIKYKRVCQVCGEEVPFDEIVKGYEFEKDNYVVFTEEEMAQIPADSIKAIDIVSFVPLEEIDPIYFQKPYYLAPEPSGIKAYKLLEQALSEAGKIGLAKITLREKERLATLRVKDGVFILETMHWPDEIREPSLRGARQERRGPPPGAGYGEVPDREPERPLPARPVPRRLPRAPGGGRSGQDRGPRGGGGPDQGAHPDPRPDGGPEGQRRGDPVEDQRQRQGQGQRDSQGELAEPLAKRPPGFPRGPVCSLTRPLGAGSLRLPLWFGASVRLPPA